MSERIVICCPKCRRIIEYIIYGTVWTKEDLERIRKAMENDLDNRSFECCGKKYSFREGWAA